MPAFMKLISSVLLAGALLMGQQSLSTIRGTVKDSTGATVAGVEITITEVGTNIRARVTKADDQGDFEAPGLKAGAYQLRAAQPGFKSFVADDIRLLSSQIRRIDVTLELGAVETQVTVSEKSAAIETEQGKIAAEFSGARYKDVPIPGNRFGGTAPVLVILPQVQGGRSGGSGITFAGQKSPQLNMGMDGVKEETLNTQTVNMEFVEEVRLVAVNNTAEYSRIGYFDTVSKRGNNQYHGEASYYQQNSALYARGFFERQKTWDLYHIFNLVGSGPIVRNKTFFYAFWNGERVPGKTFRNMTVPTEAFRRGDFSQLLGLASPVVVRDPLNGQPFAGNIIPAAHLNSVSTKVQDQFMPRPNVGAANSLVNNFDWVHPYPSDQFRADVITARIDHQLRSDNSFYGRFSAYLPRYITPGNYPTTATSSRRQSHSWVLVDTHIFSPAMINTFTFGGNRDGRDVGIEINGFQPPQGAKVVGDLGLQGLSSKVQSFGDKGSGFPIMNITGYTSLTTSHGGRQDPWSFTFADAVTRSTNRHVLKFGGELRTYRDFNGLVPDSTYGRFGFNGSLSNNAYADFLLGLPFQSERLDPIVDRYRTSKELGLFVTDTFKVNSKLNLDIGLRWDYFTATTFRDGLMFNWDPASANVIVPQAVRDKVSRNYPTNIGIVTGDAVARPDRKNFAPRLAAAYRLSDKTVFRGGYGIYNEFFGRFVRAEGGGPFQIGDTYFNTITDGRALFQFPNPFPTGSVTSTIPSQSANGYPSQTSNGLIHQYNATIEQQWRDIGMRLSYIGSRSSGLNYNLSLNKPQPSLIAFTAARRPYPQFVTLTYPQTDGQNKYDSFTLEAKRRTGWITFDGVWTWAKSMSDNLNLENPYSHTFWNREDSIPKHRVVINSLFELPVGRGKTFLSNIPKPADYAIGGWKIAWIAFFQTGQFFSPSFAGSDPSRTNTVGGLPDRTCNGNLPAGERRISRWFDGSCFAVPQAGRFGNSGVNILEGPGLHSHAVSITKRFMLTERIWLDYMATGSNVFNHPNFEFPGANISVPGQLGIITAQHGRFRAERSGARFMDMRLRLQF